MHNLYNISFFSPLSVYLFSRAVDEDNTLSAAQDKARRAARCCGDESQPWTLLQRAAICASVSKQRVFDPLKQYLKGQRCSAAPFDRSIKIHPNSES